MVTIVAHMNGRFQGRHDGYFAICIVKKCLCRVILVFN